MKNILDEKPRYDLTGRLSASVQFVNDEDIKDKDVLNIGCGFGWCELNFLSRGVNQVAGIEISEEDLKTARENIVDEKVKFCVGSAIDLPFSDQSFDTVVSWEVIEHIPKDTKNKMFSEVQRVLKKDGIFYLSTPHLSFWATLLDPAWWLIGHRHYEKGVLIGFAKDNGFEVEKIITKGGFWELMGTNNLYISKWIFKRSPFFENLFEKKQNEEFGREVGFTNVFLKCKKSA